MNSNVMYPPCLRVSNPERLKTRMHSSIMRTARFNGHLGWGGETVFVGGVCPGGVHPPDQETDTSPDPEADPQTQRGRHPHPREQND